MSSRSVIGTVIAVVLLVACAVGAASGAASTSRAAAAHSQATVRGPLAVRPGGRVRIILSGFTPSSRVRVQFGVYFHPVRNCCVSDVFPSPARPGILIGSSGRRVLTVVMPRRWSQCVTAACPTPEWCRYRSGQRVFVAAFNSEDSQYAQHLARVSSG
jgi:hypothetical protein